MTPEQKLEMARECAAVALRNRNMPSPSIEANDIENGNRDEHSAVQSALLAIERMQERVRAETERCARIAEGHVNRPLHLLPKTIAAAIRETPHAEG